MSVVRSYVWHAKSCLGAVDDEVSPGSGTVYQASHKCQTGIGITNVEPVIFKLVSKEVGYIRFQIAYISASIH